jgi:hypothetical protein
MPFSPLNQHALRLINRTWSGALPAALWWQTGFKTWQTMLAAPQVVAHRTARMAAAGPFPNAADAREFSMMGTEKVLAFSQAWMGVAREVGAFQQRMATAALGQWWSVMSACNPITVWRPLTGFPPSRNLTNASARLIRGVAAGSARSARDLAMSALPRIAHSAVSPIHAKTTSNAKRLRRRS